MSAFASWWTRRRLLHRGECRGWRSVLEFAEPRDVRERLGKLIDGGEDLVHVRRKAGHRPHEGLRVVDHRTDAGDHGIGVLPAALDQGDLAGCVLASALDAGDERLTLFEKVEDSRHDAEQVARVNDGKARADRS
jgi:hypothetical protein